MITAALGLDISNFTGRLKEAGKAISEFASKGSGMGGVALGAVGVAAAGIAAAGALVGVAVKGMYDAMSEGGALVDLTERTGVGIEKLMQLKIAFEQAGLGADEVGPTINKLQKHIADAASGNKEAMASFQQLGLSFWELQSMAPEEQLLAVGDAISAIQDPAQKSAASMALFGKSGGKLLAMFSTGGLKDAAEALGQQGKIMAANAGVFDKITDTLGTAGIKMQGFFVGMASAIAPQLLSAVEAFNSIDLSQVGVEIGSWVATFMEAFSSGNFGTLVADALIYAGALGADYLYRSFSAALSGAASIFASALEALFNPSFWKALGNILLGLAQQFAATILDAIPGMGGRAEKMQASGTRRLEMGIGEASAIGFGAMQQVAKDTALGFAQPSGVDLEGALSALKDTAGEFAKAAEARAEKARAENPAGAGLGEAGVGDIVPRAQAAGGAIVSSLAAMGGGYSGAAPTGPSLLDENRKQTDYLAEIVNNTKELLNGVIAGPDFSEMPTAVLA
jgi:hypothetical protein